MKVLGIVGSPRGERGRSYQVVEAILGGARDAGAQVEVMSLVKEQPQYCIHCGHDCFSKGDCIQEEGATTRSQRIETADALVIAVPVYCWQPCGLTVALFDKMRLMTGAWSREGEHGKPALGIAVAGGTGTGVFPALQSIYAWLCLWKYRPLAPLPVMRFNLERLLVEAPSYGQALAQCVPQPYAGVWELMLTYDHLPYMDYRRIDEFRWLAEQAVAGLHDREGLADQIADVQRLLDEGGVLAETDDEIGAAKAYIEAYRLGASLW